MSNVKLNVPRVVAAPPAGDTKPAAAVTTPPVNAFKNGKADTFTFQDKSLTESLKQLHADAAVLQQVLPQQDPKVLIVGTARSKAVPGQNGHIDYAWAERLGEELRKQGLSVGTGAGPGAMEAPLRGHARQDTLLDIDAKRSTIGWEAGEPTRQGANIILPHEQGASPFVQEGRLASMEKFLFRMEFLFRNTTDLVNTPGGYGTIAELFTFMAMKSHKHIGDPILFGAPDTFWNTVNDAAEPFLNAHEKPDLKNVFTDPAKLAEAAKTMADHVPEEELNVAVGRMVDQLELGFHKLDGRPKAFAFFAGMGERSQAAAPIVADIAKSLAQRGANMRVGGSPAIDKVVLDAARSVNPKIELEAFALEDAPVKSTDGLDYTRVKDVLVIRELMNTNINGIVVAPEGAKQLGLLFTAACDVQTGELPKIPIVVIDPDGKFDGLLKAFKQTMLSNLRKYINPEDLDIFTTVKSSAEALEFLNDPSAHLKRQAAKAAVEANVKSGQTVGLGTGSTMKYAIQSLGDKLKTGELTGVTGVSTSERTTAQAKGLDIPLAAIGTKVDVAIDGADEVMARPGGGFNLIKGMGGALLREKQVAQDAGKFVVVVDGSKMVDKLGTKSPLPVEVRRDSANNVLAQLSKQPGATPTLRMKDGQPFVTDNGNFIVDVKFADGIANPDGLKSTLDRMHGVQAHGLFLGMAHEVIVASDTSIKTLK